MEIRQIKHFVAVAHEMHFSRAAERLNIVQSALSTSIAVLEQELGVRLFHRTTRQVRLTSAGEAFYDKAILALSGLREAQQAVAAVRELQSGSLVIGTVQTLPAFLDLPAILAEFHEAYPGIQVRLRQGNKLDMPAQLLSGELDLAITSMMDRPRKLHTQILEDEAMMLVCAPGHPLADRKRITLEALSEYDFVDFQPGWGTRPIIDRHWEGFPQRRVVFEVSDLDTMLALVRRGLGIAIVPHRNARVQDGSLIAIELAGPPIRWGMILMHRKEQDAAVSAFLGLPGLREFDHNDC